jgi:hypothetical protein
MADHEKLRINPDNAIHNLDAKLEDQDRAPTRDVAEADFAAEAHGFTAYEEAGHGSTYDGSEKSATAAARTGVVGRFRALLTSIFQR